MYNSADDMSQPATRLELDVIARQLAGVTREVHHLCDSLPELVESAARRGTAAAMLEEPTIHRVWAIAAEYTWDEVSKYIGKRILAGVTAAIIVAAVTWALMTGRIK